MVLKKGFPRELVQSSAGEGTGEGTFLLSSRNPCLTGTTHATAFRGMTTNTSLSGVPQTQSLCYPAGKAELLISCSLLPAEYKYMRVCVCVCVHIWWWCSVDQSCLTLCNPTGCSTPGFPDLTISQSLLRLGCVESVMPSNSHYI